MTIEKPCVDRRADDHTGGGDGEQAGETGLRKAVALHEEQGRRIHIGEQAGERRPANDRKAQAHRVGQRPPITADDSRRPKAASLVARMRFLKPERREERDNGADATGRGRSRARSQRQDARAERRRDQRSDAKDERDAGELEAPGPAVEQVADDGPRQNADRARADALKEPENKQRADRRGERAAERAEREKTNPGEHHRFAAVSVRERAHRDRRGREAGDEDRDRAAASAGLA